MSIAHAQAQKFFEQVAAERRVFTITEDGETLLFGTTGKRVMPLWSSRSRVERIQKLHPRYRAYRCSEMTLESFLEGALARLEADDIRVGVNWSGQHLVGIDLPARDLREILGHYLEVPPAS